MVEMAIVNPLKVALVLQDLTLLWQFVPLTCDGPQLSYDKLDSSTHPVSYSNENDFCVVSVLCFIQPSCCFVKKQLRHFWPTVLSVMPLVQCVVICRLSVTFCIVAKRYVLAKKCLKE